MEGPRVGRRIQEYVFLAYFASHIPITIFVDSQGVFPGWLYPKIVSIISSTCTTVSIIGQ